MMGISTFVKTIVVFSIVSELVSNIIPNRSYKKYINLLVGVIMISLVLQPFLNDSAKNAISNAFKNSTRNTIYINKDNIDYIKEACEKNVQESTDMYLVNIGYQVKNVSLEIEEDALSEEYGRIRRLELVYSNKREQSINIKKVSFNDKSTIHNENEITEYLLEKYALKEGQVSVKYEE